MFVYPMGITLNAYAVILKGGIGIHIYAARSSSQTFYKSFEYSHALF